MQFKMIKSLMLIALACTTVVANAQIKLLENPSLAQAQNSNIEILDTPLIEKIKPQIKQNANIVATGMVCGFPSVETESLHNFFLLQFGKYKMSSDEINRIVQIHREAVTEGIIQGKEKITDERDTLMRTVKTLHADSYKVLAELLLKPYTWIEAKV